jgi:hypothetical protein
MPPPILGIGNGMPFIEPIIWIPGGNPDMSGEIKIIILPVSSPPSSVAY